MPVRRSRAFERLFPEGAIAVASRGGADEPCDLLPAESEALGPTTKERRREFALGRNCARRALAALGIADFALLRAPDRRPLWPDGIVGSITHTDSFVVAVAARRGAIDGLGIDTEIVGAVRERLWPKIAGAAEREWLAALPHRQRAFATALLFSAKEAFYKCQYPRLSQRFGFHDVAVLPGPWRKDVGEFAIQIRSPASSGALPPVIGRYRRHGRYVSTGVAMLAGGAP